MSGPVPLFRKLLRSQSGTQTVEFAMVLPLLLLLIFGMIDFGRGYFSWLIITNGAREGARAASVGKTSSVITAKVEESVTGLAPLSPGCGSQEGALCVKVTNPQGASGTSVIVDVTYNFKYLVIPGLMSLVGASSLPGGTFPLTAHATMRLE